MTQKVETVPGWCSIQAHLKANVKAEKKLETSSVMTQVTHMDCSPVAQEPKCSKSPQAAMTSVQPQPLKDMQCYQFKKSKPGPGSRFIQE